MPLDLFDSASEENLHCTFSTVDILKLSSNGGSSFCFLLRCSVPLPFKLRSHLSLNSHHIGTRYDHYHRYHHLPQLQLPDAEISCFSVLNSCTDQQTLSQIHAFIICSGFQSHVTMAAKLITLYTHFGFLDSAISIFEKAEKYDSCLWNVIIRAHVDSGFYRGALSFYHQMRKNGILPDNFTFPMLNRALSRLKDHMKQGETIHCVVIKMGFGFDLYFCNTSIEMYANLAALVSARKVFDIMPQRDLISWTSMISAYVKVGNFNYASWLFRRMIIEELKPNTVTLLIMLQACSFSGNFVQGRQLHGYIIKEGFHSSKSLQNSILTMYTKTGCWEEAEFFFDWMEERDVVSWNIMILGYSLQGDILMAAKIFWQMRIGKAFPPSLETLTTLISACAKSGNLLLGKTIHNYTVKNDLKDVFLQTSLVGLYAKCGELAIATQLFENISEKNSISWSVMISGFAQNGYAQEAMELFLRMRFAGLKPGADVLTSLAHACTQLGALQMGKGIHGYVLRNGFNTDASSMESSILNMYAKCGNIIAARRCFDQMNEKDVVDWSSMIEAYGIHGHGIEALQLFNKMEEEGVEPNKVTFISLLSACSHSGLVNEGCEKFDYMRQKYGIIPELNHYTCMVDLLGRAGQLQCALGIINNMPIEPDGRIWGALLAACKIYSDTEIGSYAAKCLFDVEPENDAYLVVLSNIHAGDMKWNEAENVREMMRERKLKKKPGWSFIETGSKLHGFVVGDRSHPQAEEIYGILRCLSWHMEEA